MPTETATTTLTTEQAVVGVVARKASLEEVNWAIDLCGPAKGVFGLVQLPTLSGTGAPLPGLPHSHVARAATRRGPRSRSRRQLDDWQEDRRSKGMRPRATRRR